jgi:hypothetical protein
LNGENYLIPADANIGSESLLRHRALPLSFTLDELTSAGNALNVVVLDACRDFPAAWSRSGKKGLSVVSGQPKNSIVVYATSAGSTASDGEGRNGLFTTHLLNNLKTPGLEVAELFQRTGADVARASGNRQFPAVYSQFFGSAYLGRAAAQPAPAPQAIPAGLEWKVEGSGVTITEYTGNASVVDIPDRINGLPVTKIGSYNHPVGGFIGAFAISDALTSISIPSSVADIDEPAFPYCHSLTSITVDGRNSYYASNNGVLFDKQMKTLIRYPSKKSGSSYTIPSSVTAIGRGAFQYCDNLTSVTIPSSVTSIGDEAFDFCRNLINVTIPSSVTAIGRGTFYDCRNLTSVTIPNSVTAIGDKAFWSCDNLTSVTIPSSVTAIGRGTFYDCYSLTSVTIPSSVTSIGDEAFFCCYNLTSVTIPSSVTSIGHEAFRGCRNLTSVTIPSSVTAIENFAFVFSGLKSVTLSRRTRVGVEAFPQGVQIRYSD